MPTSKNKLMESLGNVPAQAPIKKAPTTYPLSTQRDNAPSQDDEIATSHENTNAQSQERIIATTQKNPSVATATSVATAPAKDEPKRVSRGYKLREDLIKSLKRIALEEDRLLYEVMEEAMVEYLERKKAG
ncbi:MAG: hypothetical protein J0I20_22470 [Chloroflexi bacterium]|nr:hypothetical protein [Chloroflexota bacterium]OJV99141.1 MAG: hypothetical protein BGO39_16940 [Chloroflexi bacterium 54-19]